MSKLFRALSCGVGGRRRRSSSSGPSAPPACSGPPASPPIVQPKPDTNFWDLDGFESVIKRCTEGHSNCENVIEIIKDRAKIEENYIKALKDWQKKWNDVLDNKTNEYGTLKEGYVELLKTGEKTANYHDELQRRLTDKANSPMTEIKEWLKIHYKKDHIHYKKQKEFSEQFTNAQKPWSEYYKQLKKLEKEYHSSVKASYEGEQNLQKSLKNPDKSEEQRKKNRNVAENAHAERKTAMKRYEEYLKLMDNPKNNFMDDMKRVFERTQDFEKLRIKFLKDIFVQYHKCFNDHFNDPKYREIYKEFLEKVNKIDPDADLKWWAANFGPGMTPNWPKFTEYKG